MPRICCHIHIQGRPSIHIQGRPSTEMLRHLCCRLGQWGVHAWGSGTAQVWPIVAAVLTHHHANSLRAMKRSLLLVPSPLARWHSRKLFFCMAQTEHLGACMCEPSWVAREEALPGGGLFTVLPMNCSSCICRRPSEQRLKNAGGQRAQRALSCTAQKKPTPPFLPLKNQSSPEPRVKNTRAPRTQERRREICIDGISV